MTDDSKFVFRWEIDPSDPGLAEGKVESAVFNEEGFRWAITAEQRVQSNRQQKVDFSLYCDANHDRTWRCEGDVEMHPIKASGEESTHIIKDHFGFDGKLRCWQHPSDMWWSTLCGDFYKINGKITIEVRITISSESVRIIDLAKFYSPNETCNATLIIGDDKLKVSKDYLAVHSPVFAAMFYGEFVEKGKEEVEIKEVVYDEFIDLLQLIYLRTVEITDRSVLHILKLADKFQIETVINLSEKHLKLSTKFDVTKKLMFADQYRLPSLKDQCLKSFTNITDLTGTLNASTEFPNYSADMKVSICELVMKLNLQ